MTQLWDRIRLPRPLKQPPDGCRLVAKLDADHIDIICETVPKEDKDAADVFWTGYDTGWEDAAGSWYTKGYTDGWDAGNAGAPFSPEAPDAWEDC